MRANVYALDAANGQLLWKTHVEDHPLARITGCSQALQELSLCSGFIFLRRAIPFYMQYPCCTFRGSVVGLGRNDRAASLEDICNFRDACADQEKLPGDAALGASRCRDLELSDN